jgi:hypothetical protein
VNGAGVVVGFYDDRKGTMSGLEDTPRAGTGLRWPEPSWRLGACARLAGNRAPSSG